MQGQEAISSREVLAGYKKKVVLIMRMVKPRNRVLEMFWTLIAGDFKILTGHSTE